MIGSACSTGGMVFTGRMLSTGYVARETGYSRETIRAMCVSGQIPAVRLHERAQWKIPAVWFRQKLAK